MSVVTTDVRRALSAEHIRGMAPDHATLRGAVELARSDNWEPHHWSDRDGGRIIWAEIGENRRTNVRVAVTLPEMRVACSCFATRFPCRHIIAVLLQEIDDQGMKENPPDWLEGLLNRYDMPAGDEARRHLERLPILRAGMADLQKWVSDLMRQGLATLPKRNRSYWLDAADRLVDSYAFEAARELRDCATIPSTGSDWPERLLPRLGNLALLGEAFRRFDDLTQEDQGDALSAAGQLPFPNGPAIADNWLVLGHRIEIENKQRRERTWLQGLESGRWAVLLATEPVGRQDGVCLPTGAVARGELAFVPGNYPLAARPQGDLRIAPIPFSGARAGTATIDESVAAYAAALAANPWLRSYPMALRDVFIEPPHQVLGNSWRIRDRGGSILPLPDRFPYGWQLLALGADRSLSLFGEWDGATLTPVSVFDGGWRAMAGWRGFS